MQLPASPRPRPRSLDADAVALVDALANRSRRPDPHTLDAGRALVADVAATRAPPSPAAARALDAVAGATTRAWRARPAGGGGAPVALDRDARLLRCYAATGHASLAVKELAGALLAASGAALAADAAAGAGGRRLATLPAAAAVARAAAGLGYAPGGVLLDALLAGLAVGVGAPLAAGGRAAPPAAVVDALCAAAAARHALPPSVAASLAAARFTPIQAATAAAALTALGSPPCPRLVSALRVRVAGARAGMPPAAAAAAAAALAAWGEMDAGAAASLLDAAAAGVDAPAGGGLGRDDWTLVWAAAGRAVDAGDGRLTPRAGRGLAVARDAAEAHCAARRAEGVPAAFVGVDGWRAEPPSLETALEYCLTPQQTARSPSPPLAVLAHASTNAPHVPLGVLTAPGVVRVTSAGVGAWVEAVERGVRTG